MNRADLLQESIEILTNHGIGSAVTDAEVIMSHILDVERYRLRTHGDEEITPSEEEEIRRAVRRRSDHEPVAYITGYREFYSLPFIVDSSVLIPRPETELLVDLALYYIPYSGTLLDLCTGSGAIALAVKKNRSDAVVTATDISIDALVVAEKNNSAICGDNGVTFLQGDLFDPVEGMTFDVIVSNPPYVGTEEKAALTKDLSFEPQSALFSGPQGLDHITRIIAKAGEFLRENGALILETGHDMRGELKSLAEDADFTISQFTDNGGFDRVALFKKR
jgi:release factor glutamine methyltransferase